MDSLWVFLSPETAGFVGKHHTAAPQPAENLYKSSFITGLASLALKDFNIQPIIFADSAVSLLCSPKVRSPNFLASMSLTHVFHSMVMPQNDLYQEYNLAPAVARVSLGDIIVFPEPHR